MGIRNAQNYQLILILFAKSKKAISKEERKYWSPKGHIASFQYLSFINENLFRIRFVKKNKYM
jgi:hypothetical protein